MERELDPIVMKYRDFEREQNYLHESMSKSQLHLSKPRNPMAGTLNIFNMPPPRETTAEDRKKKTITRDWNLISHFPADLHGKVQITAPFEETQKLRPKTTYDPNTKRKNGREFNVISNDYYVDNEKRKVEDYEKVKQHVNDRYWKTHDFDVLKCQYIDGEKEAKFREQREVLAKLQGTAKSQKYPPRYVICVTIRLSNNSGMLT
jgi:hypothetical protein